MSRHAKYLTSTLAKAAEHQGATAIVLANAASRIFAPQATGFTAGKGQFLNWIEVCIRADDQVFDEIS